MQPLIIIVMAILNLIFLKAQMVEKHGNQNKATYL